MTRPIARRSATTKTVTAALRTERRAARAVRRRDVLALVDAGGNVYYLAKFAGIFGLGVQDIGAQQTGVTVEEFRAKLMAAAN